MDCRYNGEGASVLTEASLKGTLRMMVLLVPPIFSNRWSHDVPRASGMRRVRMVMRGAAPSMPCVLQRHWKLVNKKVTRQLAKD